MLELLLIAALGFLGSFGHCVGMCGPIAVGFSLSKRQESSHWWTALRFHILLNLGRMLSYGLVGAAIGMVGSVVMAGGQMAGVGSLLRRCIVIITGLLLIWSGLSKVSPTILPSLPFLHPFLQDTLHHRLSKGMSQLSAHWRWWTPLALGLAWGLIPCGFLYAAQIKAAEAGEIWRGSTIMVAFGLGTLPSMLGVGMFVGAMGADRRSQLFQLGGWLMILIGLLTLFRTGDMVDISGHAAIAFLSLALIARPTRHLWPALMQGRRVLGVGAFGLAIVHTLHMVAHHWQWNWYAWAFLVPQHQWSLLAGAIAVICMTPAAFTSFDSAQRWLGHYWRKLHLLSVPALVLATLHTVGIGSHYGGAFQMTWMNYLFSAGAIALAVGVCLIRSRLLWRALSLESLYGSSPPLK